MTDRELLRHIERLPNARAGYKQLVRELGLGGGQERRLLREQLGRLTGTRQLLQTDGDHWSIPKPPSAESKPHKTDLSRRHEVRSENLVAGRLDLHRDGYGFVRPNPREAGGRAPVDEDVFIPPPQMAGAMQGDQVLVELAPPARDRNDNRRSGR